MRIFKNNFLHQKMSALPKDFYFMASFSPFMLWCGVALYKDHQAAQARFNALPLEEQQKVIEEMKKTPKTCDAIGVMAYRPFRVV